MLVSMLSDVWFDFAASLWCFFYVAESVSFMPKEITLELFDISGRQKLLLWDIIKIDPFSCLEIV